MSQEQVDAYDASIATIDAEIAMIDAESIGVTGVQEYVTARRNSLVNKKNVFTFRRDLVQVILDNQITTEEQTAIDGMNTLFNNRFADHLSHIANRSVAERNEFFSVYALAETDVVRECIINHFFRL